jgi:hypothetical protein
MTETASSYSYRHGDTFVVTPVFQAGTRHMFGTEESLVRFLRAQQAGSAWEIAQMRDGIKVAEPWPMLILDTIRHQRPGDWARFTAGQRAGEPAP